MLTYGGGGGGGLGCRDEPDHQPAITFEYDPYNTYNAIVLCLWGIISSGLPFQVELTSPDGKIFRSNDLRVDQNTQEVMWQGYQGFEGYFDQQQKVTGLSIAWPNNLLSGKWHATVHAGGNQTAAYLSIVREKQPSISAIDLQAETEIVPVTGDSNVILHPLRLEDNGNVNLIGMNYPANVPIYILVFQKTNPPGQFSGQIALYQEQSVLSNSNGSFTMELSGPFEVDHYYMIVGISDPNISLVLGTTDQLDTSLPFDFFRVVASTAVSNPSKSCAGAPPQRMVVQQRGYACTKKDRVNIREAPKKSATAIDFLSPTDRFQVVAGPQCADKQSWWQIQTGWGTTGWVSEGGDATDPYFICPLP
jgi:hypothetical protein